MSKIQSQRILFIKSIILFSIFITHHFSAAQNNIFLESNYQVAWGGGTYSSTLSSLDRNFVFKTLYWFGRKGVYYPINIYDAKTFRLIKQITPGEDVHYMKLSGDGKKLFLCGWYKKTIEVWDVETREKLKEIETPFKVMNFDVSNDGLQVLYWLYSGCLVDVKSGKLLFDVKTNAKETVGFCNNDSTIIVAQRKEIISVDSRTGKVDFTLEIPDGDVIYTQGDQANFVVDKTKKYFLLRGFNSKKNTSFTYYGTIEDKKPKIINTIPDGDNFEIVVSKAIFSDDLQFMYGISNQDFRLLKYNLKDGKLVLKTEIVPTKNMKINKGSTSKQLIEVTSIRNGDYLLITDNYNVSYLYSVKEDKVKAWLYSFGFDYAFVTPDGRMDGTRGAIEKLQWVKGDQKIPLSATYDQMYTPNLMSQVFSNTLQENTVNLETIVKYTPEIKITNPKTEFKASSSALSVTCELKENGDEIKQVRIYVNDKLVSDETRGMKAAGNTVTYNVTLLPGINSVKAVAITKNGYQSGAAEVSVTYTGAVAESRLFVLAVGIDKYKNPAYNLNFAVADASAVVERIKSSGAGIFKTINIYSYQNESAKRDSILSGFDKIAAQAQPQDAFVLFYAGHGVMSEGTPETPKDFYLVLQNVTQAYGNDERLKNQGISAAELRELSKKITAQKQVVFLDACQSGAAVETFAMRGMAEEKAILQLARSTGSYLIASTGSEQFATEFKELGHGVFTYAILQGLNCNADGSEKDKKVTIKELEAYLNDNIPTLTEKYHGTVQYPKSWSKGMDFPISVCK